MRAVYGVAGVPAVGIEDDMDVEMAVRLAWDHLVQPSEKSLLELESVPLGRALREECLNSPATWMRMA